MKLIKMKLSRNYTTERTRYSYPKEYEAQKVLFGPVYEKGALERGQDYQWIIFGVRDDDAARFLASHNTVQGNFTFEAVEISNAEAVELGNAWVDQMESVTNPIRVLAVCAKAVRGETLTAEDLAVLDPEKPETGINKTKTFEERLNETVTKGL